MNNFYDCAKNGGKVINKKTKDGKVIKVCYDKAGKSYVKRNKNKKKKFKRFEKASLNSLKDLANFFNSRRT